LGNYQTTIGGATHDYLSLKEGAFMRGHRLEQANQIAKRQFKKRCNIDEWFWNWIVKGNGPDDIRRETGILRKTRKRCSCWMCGHRRKYEGLTLQERRLNEEFQKVFVPNR
jgi:hypothetical protein